MLLKGPTGCGKTRFVEYMAWRLRRPLITVACHDDLTSGDLVGRYLIQGSDTVWTDGPLTRAVRAGALCYLDEIVEARKDTTVVIHPLADNRRILPIEKRGEIVAAPPEFMLVISFNPGYQSIMKDLKPSTRQRFVSLEFSYPEEKRRWPSWPRNRMFRKMCEAPCQARPDDAQPQGKRAGRRREHETAHPCGEADPIRHRAPGSLPGGGHQHPQR